MRNFLKSAVIAGVVVAVGLGLAQAAPAADVSVAVGNGWGWHPAYWGWERPYWGWQPLPVIRPVPEPVYVAPPVYVPAQVYDRNEPRLNFLLDELGSSASRISADRASGRLSAASYDSLMAQDSGIRSRAIHAADVHGWLPDDTYYRLRDQVEGLSHDISRLAG